MAKLNKKIIVITTGGTIGSILRSGAMSVDLSGRKVIQEIKAAQKTLGYEVEVRSPINKNSEILSPEDWVDILTSIQEACEADISGVVVTHGTDTLAYTVAAALSLSHLWKTKICFTAAYHPPDYPYSDTSLSLLAALAFAASAYPTSGVYVAFRSNENNSKARILNGFHLKPMDFDESYFSSAYDNVVATYSPEYGLSNDVPIKKTTHPKIAGAVVPSKERIAAARHKVACINLYPGLDRATLQAVTQGREIVIIQLYHCGTGPFGSDYNDIIDHIQKHSENTLFLLATFPGEHIQTPYESTQALIDAGGCIYKNIQPHFLYAFSIISIAIGNTKETVKSQLSDWQVLATDKSPALDNDRLVISSALSL